MLDRKGKRAARLGGLLVIAAAASVLALVFAGSSGAAGTPPGGVGCNFTDGRIDAQGATLQTRAQAAWITGYSNDICGFSGTGNDGGLLGSTNDTMVDYNGINNAGDAGVITAPNGSGNGLKAFSCREVPFTGSDKPYTASNLVDIDSNPGVRDGDSGFTGLNGSTECTDFHNFQNPFYGTANLYPFVGPNGGTDNSTSDQKATTMSFPVAGTAVTVDIYFGNAVNCPTSPQLTGTQLAQIYGGVVVNWSDLGGAYANCKANGGGNLAIRRIVRADDSGTTQNFLGYLNAVDGSNSADLCNGQTWHFYFNSSPNTSWPTGGTCPNNLVQGISTANASGNPGVLDTCSGINSGTTQDPGPVPGSICYADLPDLENGPAGYSVLKVAKLPSGANPSVFVSPFNGTRANCDFSGVSTPGPSNDGAVGLAQGSVNPDSWAFDNNPTGTAVVYHENVANQGTGWPACAVTFDLAWVGMHQSAATAVAGGNNPLSGTYFTDDMRRTEYSYLLYALTQGQSLLTSLYYQNLPQGLLNQEIAGFKNNY